MLIFPALSLHTGIVRGLRVPFDLRILRILLPAPTISIFIHNSSVPILSQLTSNDLHLRNTVTIPQHNTNLRRGCTFPCKLADIVDDGLGGGLEPGGHGARIRDRGGADAFAFAVKTTHLCGW